MTLSSVRATRICLERVREALLKVGVFASLVDGLTLARVTPRGG